MADVVPATDANSQEAAPATSTGEAQSGQVNPPAAESAATEGQAENRVPQSRFNEVIEQRNRERDERLAMEAELRELRSRVTSTQQQESVVDKQVKRLVEKLKLTPEAAAEIVASQEEISRSQNQQVAAQMKTYQFQGWQQQMEQKYKDYRELMPQMEKVYMSLNPQGQNYAVSSLDGLEYVYSKAKASVADKQVAESYSKGQQAAYETRATKQALASGPAGTAATQTGKLTLKAIREMDIKEYQKRLPEINKAIQNGTLVD